MELHACGWRNRAMEIVKWRKVDEVVLEGGSIVNLVEGVFEFAVLLLIRDGSCDEVEGIYSLPARTRLWTMIFRVNRIPC